MIKSESIKAVLTLLVLDILWIYYFMGPRYHKLVLNIQSEKMKVNIYSGFFAYIFMVYLLLEVVLKYKMTLKEGFIFGFMVYGIYDLTCGAIFKKWDFQLAIIDMIWGGFVYMASIYVSKL